MAPLCVLLFVTSVLGHSWIACTDYQPPASDKLVHPTEPALPQYSSYSTGYCKGFPRGWIRKGAGNGVTTWGEEYFEYKVWEGTWGGQGNGGLTCQIGAGETYPSQFPMANYTAGTNITIVWPAKGHVPENCGATNKYQRDHFNALYISPKKTTITDVDPSQDTFESKPTWFTAAAFPHVFEQVDYKGYGNCPQFCSNNQNSPCYGYFTVPSNLATGVYTFQWLWMYNNEVEEYRTCWDAYVTAAANGGGSTGGNGGGNGGGGTTAPSTPIFRCLPEPTLSGDQVHIKTPPSQIKNTGMLDLTVKFSAVGDRQIVVGFYSDVNKTMSYGTALASVRTGSGTVDVRLSILNTPALDSELILGAYLYDQTAYTTNSNTAPVLSQELREILIGSTTLLDDPECGSAATFGPSLLAALLLLFTWGVQQ